MNQGGGEIVSALAPQGDIGNKAKSFVLIALAIIVIVIIIIAIKKGTGVFATITDSIDGILIKMHLKESPETAKANADVAAVDTKASSVASPFNPVLYKSAPGGTSLMTSANANAMAHQIYDSVGIFYDDPESGFGAIKQAKNWYQVSQISDAFNKLFGKDVYGWLKIKYDTTTQKDVLAKLVNYAFNLPKS